jgi:hypothetical protein
MVHAWNVLPSGSEDTHGATAVAIVAGVVVFAAINALAWSLTLGARIAAYTLVDKHGIAHADAPSDLEIVFSVTAVGRG